MLNPNEYFEPLSEEEKTDDIFALNFIGEGLEEAFNPKGRN